MSVITIGSFTTNRLTAQPFGYEGEARFGRTARTFRISGLLTPTEWQTLVSEYNAWRSTRIQDPDTLVSKVVGTTIAFSTGVSINNLSVTNLACWFAEAPAGEQAGKYISATVVMVDAAQALAVLLAEQDAQNDETVDCEVIKSRLIRQRNETDCELAALADGLADDFAVQRVTREVLEKGADLGARAGSAETIADLDAQLQVQSRTADVSVASSYAATLGGLSKQLEVINKTAELGINDTYAGTLSGLDAQLEISNKTAQLGTLGTYGAEIEDLDAQINIIRKTNQLTTVQGYGAEEAQIDLQIEKAQADNRLAAYEGGDLAGLRGTLLDIEMAEAEADITAIETRIEALKTSRTTKALWDKYLSEDLVPHGTESFGGAEVVLTAPPETRSNGPNVEFTATGNTLVSGPAKSMLTKQVVGYTNAAGASGLLSWYDSTIAAPVAAGQWFPTQAPQFTTEYVLVDGVKSTRYNVTMTVVQLT